MTKVKEVCSATIKDEYLPFGVGVPMYEPNGSKSTDKTTGRILYRHEYLCSLPPRSDCEDVIGPAGQKIIRMSSVGVIRTLNAAFGHGGWGTEVTRERVVRDEKDLNGRWVIGYIATVKLTLRDGVCFEDCGSCEVINDSATLAHERALRGAISSAMRRAASCLGERLGNGDSSLKTKKDVSTIAHEINETIRSQETNNNNSNNNNSSSSSSSNNNNNNNNNNNLNSSSSSSLKVSIKPDNSSLDKKKVFQMLNKPKVEPLQKQQYKHQLPSENHSSTKSHHRHQEDQQFSTKSHSHYRRHSRPEPVSPAVFTFSPKKIHRRYTSCNSFLADEVDNQSTVSCPSRTTNKPGEDNNNDGNAEENNQQRQPKQQQQQQAADVTRKEHVRHRYRTVFVDKPMEKQQQQQQHSNNDAVVKQTPSSSLSSSDDVSSTTDKENYHPAPSSTTSHSGRSKDDPQSQPETTSASSLVSATSSSHHNNNSNDPPANVILTPSSSLMVEDIKSMRSRIHRYRSLCVQQSSSGGATNPTPTEGGGVNRPLSTSSSFAGGSGSGGGGSSVANTPNSNYTPRVAYSLNRIINSGRE